jgi:hypothetical protein
VLLLVAASALGSADARLHATNAQPPQAVVQVSTEPQLQSAMSALTSNTTLVLAPGTYRLTRTLWFNGALSGVVIRGATGNRDDVVLQGPGMTNGNYGGTPYGIWTGNGVEAIVIADVTIRDFYHHGIIFNAGTQNPRVTNVRILDIGTQFIKANPDGPTGVNRGIVERSVIEYSTRAPSSYTNGVDVLAGQHWIIRGNVFRNIVSPPGTLAGPSVLMWSGAGHTVTEANLFLNCARGVAYGLVDRPGGSDHAGGVIRNNMIVRTASQPGDTGISVADSPGTQVLNNTIYLSGTYGAAIEYRFPGTSGVLLVNNLHDGTILRRDGASGTEQRNLRATSATFVNAAAGDLHLVPGASAIDAGVNLAAVPSDFDGHSRPQGAATDVGADEYAQSGGPTRSLMTVVNGHTFRAGDTMTLTAVLTPDGRSDAVDAYIVVRLPGGGYLSLVNGTLVPGLAPIVRGVVPVPYTGVVVSLRVPAGTPPGTYTWLSTLTVPGTLTLAAPLAETPFTIVAADTAPR